MQQPWADPSAAPAARAELVLAAMTLEEKVGLVHAPMGVAVGGHPKPPGAAGGAGYNPGGPGGRRSAPCTRRWGSPSAGTLSRRARWGRPDTTPACRGWACPRWTRPTP